jgi:hypothetical protein
LAWPLFIIFAISFPPKPCGLRVFSKKFIAIFSLSTSDFSL